jgi:hypothetical protein
MGISKNANTRFPVHTFCGIDKTLLIIKEHWL